MANQSIVSNSFVDFGVVVFPSISSNSYVNGVELYSIFSNGTIFDSSNLANKSIPQQFFIHNCFEIAYNSNLAIGQAVFGVVHDSSRYKSYILMASSDQGGTLGLDESPDNITYVTGMNNTSVTGGTPVKATVVPSGRFIRVKYTNGSTASSNTLVILKGIPA